eukprot:3826403-Lingulodinium_polyedra.AAC.1
MVARACHPWLHALTWLAFAAFVTEPPLGGPRLSGGTSPQHLSLFLGFSPQASRLRLLGFSPQSALLMAGGAVEVEAGLYVIQTFYGGPEEEQGDV